MNTYHKYIPNVYLAKCESKHEKNDIIDVETKHGKVNESVVFNLIFEKNGFYYYSIIRADGFNAQERAKNRAERYKSWAMSAQAKSNEKRSQATEGRGFLSLGEPIKIGHHSERRHRNLIDRNWNRMGKAVELADKAESHMYKAEYWEKRVDKINLSMPESLDYYEHKLEVATQIYQDLKDGKTDNVPDYSVSYAKKLVNEAKKKFDLAQKLWA